MLIKRIIGISLIGLLVILGACGSATSANPTPAAKATATPSPVATTPAAPAPAGGAAAMPAHMPGMDMGVAPVAPAAPAPVATTPATPPVTAPVAAPVQEGFTVSKLTMMESVTSGNNVTISFVVTNTAKQRGTYTANLKFNGDIVKTQDITLDGGSSKMIEMAVITGPVGVIKVSLDQLTGKFEVMACDI